MPNPKNVPLITNAVLGLVLIGCILLLFGAPVEDVLSITNNPVSRVVVVTFAMSLVGIGALAFSIHLLLYRNKQLEEEVAEMRQLVEAEHERTTALLATADGLEARVEGALDDLEQEMAEERARLRRHVRTYVGSAAKGVEQ